VSPVNRNFIVCYFCLVVLPIVSLAGILRTGNRLKGPVSIDGVWEFQSQSEGTEALLCLQSVPESRTVSLLISQSGKYLRLSFTPGTPSIAPGTIEGTLIKASFSPHAQDLRQGGCARDRPLTLTAAISKGDSGSMTGTLSVDNCSSCESLKFRALRKPSAEIKRAN
jgi:hypothetical protein